MELYSIHTFLFPFHWKYNSGNQRGASPDHENSLLKLDQLFEPTPWKRQPYEINTVLRYNQHAYFYDMVREAMFDKRQPTLDAPLVISRSYDLPPDERLYKFVAFGKVYTLEINAVELQLYSVGVGVLSFHLLNQRSDQSDSDDILRINQFGRRLYPPFLGMDAQLTSSTDKFYCDDFLLGLELAKKGELPDYLEVMGEKNFDDFEQFTNPALLNHTATHLPTHFNHLLRGIPFTTSSEAGNHSPGILRLTPLLDDRMFVVSWYGNNKLAGNLKEGVKTLEEKEFNPDDETLKWWYKYVFADNQWPTCQNKAMMQRLLNSHSYLRWSNYETFFGVNRYAFMCLTNDIEGLKANHAEFIVNHMQTIYFKMAELCLAQRAALLRFSDDMVRLTEPNHADQEKVSHEVSALYKRYLRFVNRIYFREVTAQEQGIELYDLMQRHMRIDDNVQKLNGEIKELNDYATLLEQQRQNRNIELLTIIGALFIIPSFVFGYFEALGSDRGTPDLGLLLLPLTLPLVTYPLVLWRWHNRRTAWRWFLRMLVPAVAAAALAWLTLVVQ